MNYPRIWKFLFLSHAIFLLSFIQTSFAQDQTWQAINKGFKESGFITTSALHEAHPKEVWTAVQNDGLYVSNDNAKTWQRLSPELFHNVYISSIDFDPKNEEIVYLTANYRGIFKSQDHGKTWTALTKGLGVLSATSLVVDPINSQILYATTSHDGIYKSVNAGENWHRIGQEIKGRSNYLSVSVNPLNPSHLLVVTLNSKTYGPDVYQSLDSGLHWNILTIPQVDIYCIAFSPINPQQIFFGGRTGLYRSDDLGKTWVHLFTTKDKSSALSTILINKEKPNEMYISVDGEGVHKTIDAGKNWQLINDKFPVAEWTELLLDDRTHSLFMTTDEDGLWQSLDDGATWECVTNTLGTMDITTVAADPQDKNYLYAGSKKHGLWIRKNNVWEKVSNDFEENAIKQILVDQQNPTSLIVLAGTDIYYSRDKGETWKKATWTEDKNSHPLWATYLVANPNNSQELFAGSHGDTIWKSIDGGATWLPLGHLDRNQPVVRVSAIVINPKNTNEMYAGIVHVYGHLIFKSLDAGKTWKQLPYIFAEESWGRDFNYLQALAIDPINPNILYAAASVGNDVTDLHFYKSEDAGLNWVTLDKGLPPVYTISSIVIDAKSPKNIYIATTNLSDFGGAGVYVSKTGGSDWTSLNEGLLNHTVTSLVLNQNQLIAGTNGSGVFVRELGDANK